MPMNRPAKPPTTTRSTRRIRPASLQGLGGASSILRLVQPTPKRLPTPIDLSDWMIQAANVLMPVTGPLSDLRFNTSSSGV
jgi:hypothetical protein